MFLNWTVGAPYLKFMQSFVTLSDRAVEDNNMNGDFKQNIYFYFLEKGRLGRRTGASQCIVVPPYPLIQYPLFTADRKI
jgi:hypothetical protein